MRKNTGYVSMMEARMKKWDADVLALGKAGAKARGEYNEKMKELRAGRDAATKTLVKCRVAGESANAQMHAGMEKAWDIMQAALKKVSADLGK